MPESNVSEILNLQKLAINKERSLLNGSVCLIVPPSSFLLDERVFTSLGILKVAASLEEEGIEVSVIDLSGIENYGEVLREHLEGSTDVALGISATTPQMPIVSEIATLIRKIRPDIRLILGGPHATLTFAARKIETKLKKIVRRADRAASQLLDLFDVVVCGDGELAILEALKANPDKIIDADDRKTSLFMDNQFYIKSPLPARHLIDLTSYRYQIDGLPATSLISQLGCPFNCGFCGGRNSPSLRVTRTRNVQSIIDEVEFLHKEYGYTGFMFYDDELNVNKDLVKLLNGLTDLQNKLGVEFRLRGFIKAELFNDEQAKAMYSAGFRWLLCGFEAADPRVLENINKRATLEDNSRAVAIAKQYGLKTKALMSCGHPGDSEDTILAIRDWLLDMDVEDFDCTIITPYPGSPYYDLAVPHNNTEGVWVYTCEESGDRLFAYEVDYLHTSDYYKGAPDGGYCSYVYTDHLSAERLVVLRDELENDVRQKLSLPFNSSQAAIRYEHSMGQGLPGFIYRRSNTLNPVR